MILRADHVAGAAFIILGLAVFAISGDLPFGTLAAPGAGMMPKLVAGLMVAFALIIIATGGSGAFSAIDWNDKTHAALVVLIAAAAIALYQTLGFLITMTALVFTLLVVVERRNILIAAAYSIVLAGFAYWLFGIALKAPLARGLLWF
jgi:hypothetical protein